MDPHSSAQDVHQCDLCETAIVYSCCYFCHVNLCKPCIGKHISDGCDQHEIVQLQEQRSTLIYPKCKTHPQNNCEFQCKDCNNIFVCSSCTESKQHKGHNYEEVTEIYKTKKEDIKMDIEKIENHIFPTYEEMERVMKNQLANLDEGYEKLTTEMSKQGERWHREIDAIINKMKTEISKMKVKHKDVLRKHLDEIKLIHSCIKETLQVIRKIEISTEVAPTIEYNSEIRDFRKLSPKIQVSLPTFIPKPIDHEKLNSLFGKLTPLSAAVEENVLSLNKTNASSGYLLDEPELVVTIETGYECLRSVTCLNEDRIWTSGETNDIKCFNLQGSLIQLVHTKSGKFPNDIGLDNDGDLLYSDWKARSVYKAKNEEATELVKLQGWKPGKLCVTSTGDLLVTMYSNDETQFKVARYSGSTEKQTIQFDDEGKPLYSGNGNIKYITENRNHDICVSDCIAEAVVVVNQDGKLRWRYTGHPSMKETFDPRGITTDSKCHILTIDNENQFIHILDQNGQFLQYIDNCDLEDPFDLCVDNNDNLFVCEYLKGKVKKIKYLS
ncbi:tripartite motif-containing protein 2-like [Magallana gigas]|uniref:tripartite motif-containing protein 2-like n=1 Tax=Magallana gigas TaxID=29159 RepID=UPI003341B512